MSDVSFKNKQRTLVFCSRGITHQDRHLMNDLQDLLPHSKKDSKFDTKEKFSVIPELCELKNCNNCIFFEARRHKDLYMWVSKAPNGPSAKFLVQNIHTMAELKLTGNCLKGSRPILSFDKNFDLQPQYRLLKELFIQAFGSPRKHPKTKPFIDHIFSFFILDNRIWFRNYQVVLEVDKTEPVLVEIGPRFTLNPIRIFSGSFMGATLYQNPNFVAPSIARFKTKQAVSTKYDNTRASKITSKKRKLDAELPGVDIGKSKLPSGFFSLEK